MLKRPAHFRLVGAFGYIEVEKGAYDFWYGLFSSRLLFSVILNWRHVMFTTDVVRIYAGTVLIKRGVLEVFWQK